MRFLEKLVAQAPEGEILEVQVGLHWTAVVAETGGERRCGLAATLHGLHDHHKEPDVPQAGQLEGIPSHEMIHWVLEGKPTQSSVGMAALNALIPHAPQYWMDANAEELIARAGAGKRVVMVGHFPFTERLRPRVGELLVLEQDPRPGDLPAEAAPRVLPQAQVVAITGMTLTNHTLDGLLALCLDKALVILMGPSTPLSPLLFDVGVDVVSGAVVTEIEPVLRTVNQGGNFRQVHRAGVRLVNLVRPGAFDPVDRLTEEG